MLTVVIILLILNILLNLAVGFLTIIVLGELKATEKFRFEFEPFVLPDNPSQGGDTIRNSTQTQFN